MTNLPKDFQYLLKLKGPKMLIAFLDIFGTTEVPGTKSNPEILRWAKVCGLEHDYINDGVAWCGLMIAYLCSQSDKPIPLNPLYALNWRHWGVEVKRGDERLGDVYVKERYDSRGHVIGGHVALMIAESKTHFYVGGGNQGDTTSIGLYPKNIRYWCRRPAYSVMPIECKKYILNANGIIVPVKET